MQSPQVPDKADLDSMHIYLKALSQWLNDLHLEGTQTPPFSQVQLNEMVSNNVLTQSGKLFYNTDTGQLNKAEVVGGNLTITPVA